VAPEPSREARLYRSIMEKRGLNVSETRARQATLTGGSVEYHAVTGMRQGEYRVTVRLSPSPHAQIVADASSSEAAQRMADRLRSLGFDVEVEKERVRASTRRPTPAMISRAIDVVEEE